MAGTFSSEAGSFLVHMEFCDGVKTITFSGEQLTVFFNENQCFVIGVDAEFMPTRYCLYFEGAHTGASTLVAGVAYYTTTQRSVYE
jgi:hypothetical protein